MLGLVGEGHVAQSEPIRLLLGKAGKGLSLGPARQEPEALEAPAAADLL